MTWPARWPALLAALKVLTLTHGAVAASPDPRPSAGRGDAGVEGGHRATVVLELQDEGGFREVLRAAIESASIGFDVEVLSGATRRSAPAAPFQVTVDEGSAWYEISVVDVERDRIYTRRVEREPSGGDEVAHEAAAHVVVYALEALGRGQTIGAPRKRSNPAAADAGGPPPSATADRERLAVVDREAPSMTSPPPRPRLAFGTRTSMTAHASNAPTVFGVGAMAALRFPDASARSGFEIAASVEQHVPTEVRSSNLSSRFQIHSPRLFVRYDLAVARTIGLGPAVGLGVDRIGVTTGPRAGGPAPTSSSHDVIGVAATSFGARAAIASHLRLQVDLGIELPWQHVEYVVQRGAGTLTFLDPWPLRPWLSIGLLAEL